MDTGYATVGAAREALSKGYPTEPTAEEVLAATSAEGLLTSHAALTRRMQVAEQHAHDYRGSDRAVLDARFQVAADLRTQRDMVAAEILRRMQP